MSRCRCHFGVFQDDAHFSSSRDLLTTPGIQGGIPESRAGSSVAALGFLQALYENLEAHLDRQKRHLTAAANTVAGELQRSEWWGGDVKRLPASFWHLLPFHFTKHPSVLLQSLSSPHCSIFRFFTLQPQLLCTSNTANFSHCFNLSSQEKCSYISNDVLCTWIFI